ncbi:MAG: putative LPS assembly protein LptD [Candidatus Kapabacteria bacterium]|nr:putative LPS assembly protein LptD [Candidatus Kapabacteria bacterium]
MKSSSGFSSCIRASFIIIFLFFNYLFPFSSYGQDSLKSDKSTLRLTTDTSSAIKLSIDDLKKQDSVKLISSSTITKKSKNEMDSTVTFSAKDTIRLRVKNRIMHLSGSSVLKYKDEKLSAEYIDIDFSASALYSYGKIDSNKKLSGFPHFLEKGEEYVGDKISFNFKTKKGVIGLGETKISNGFFFGEKIKRVSEAEFFINKGYYTTCDAPHPHFYFGSPKMKIIANNQIFLDPIIFYVQDMPIFMLPIGLFFPSKSGRQSGITIPSYFFSADRGVKIENFSIYLALSDNYDTQFGFDFFSKGGYIVKNTTRWKFTDENFGGSTHLEIGRTKNHPDDQLSTNYKIDLDQRHELNPFLSYNANIHFTSDNFYQNTSYNPTERMIQQATSNASVVYQTEFGVGLSGSYQMNQNITTGANSQSLPISVTVPIWQPLKNLNTLDWVKDFTVSANSSYIWSQTKSVDANSSSSFSKNMSQHISINPGFSISPRFSYFNISPYFSTNSNFYFRQMTQTYSSTDSTLRTSYSNGIFPEYNWSTGVNFSTTLYGMLKPGFWGLRAFRHTFRPSFGFSYSPDLSSNPGFYGRYFNTRDSSWVTYSRYSTDGGGIASRMLSKSLVYSADNNFELKVKDNDTLDKNITLLQWHFNGSVNMAADSLKWSDVGMSFNIPTTSWLNMGSSANFTPYQQVMKHRAYDSAYVPINRFLIEDNNGLLRLTNFNLHISTSYSSSNGGSVVTTQHGENDTSKQQELGERFRERVNYVHHDDDIYGDCSPGYTPFSFPWSVSFDLSYSYSEYIIHSITRTVSLSSHFSMKLTPTWNFSTSANYDFVTKQFISPMISISKDMHCWELGFSWFPIGLNQGFYLKFSARAPQLKDLKLEKRSSVIY